MVDERLAWWNGHSQTRGCSKQRLKCYAIVCLIVSLLDGRSGAWLCDVCFVCDMM